jgi:transcriptional regulator with XRE-family HTH domain
MSGRESDQRVDAYLAAFRRNIRLALADEALAEIAARAGLQPEELSDLMAGAATADLFALARLEAALGVPLWPRAGASELPDR